MDKKQAKFIKNIESKSAQEIAQFILQDGITWDELVYNTPGRFTMAKQRETLQEIERTKNITNNKQHFTEDTDNKEASPKQAENQSSQPNNDSSWDSTNSKQEKPRKKKASSSMESDPAFYNCKGRIGRSAWFGANLGLRLAVGLMNLFMEEPIDDSGFLLLVLCLQIPLLWLIICTNSKRCHDLGWSGWCQLIPFIGIVLLFFPGDKENNEYGPAR